jgi:hypothetical protein
LKERKQREIIERRRGEERNSKIKGEERKRLDEK